MRIAAVGTALPEHRYEQQELLAAFHELWGERFFNPRRLEQLHRNVLVGGRNLALPLEGYRALRGFGDANDAFIRVATDLGARAIASACAAAGLAPADVDHLIVTTVTGLAVPSLDARIAPRLAMRADLKRTPLFGLGCVGGAAGIARAADYLRGHPGEVCVLLAVELCSLTLQRDDLSIANLIASGLFGDGAAAAVLVGRDRGEGAGGPEILASRSTLYPGTERVMGWDITERGFRVVLSPAVPDVVTEHLRADVEAFLGAHGVTLSDIATVVSHPGGPKVLRAVEQALHLDDDALALSWRSLKDVGNLSSASVLFVLGDTLAERRPVAGSLGLLLAMGPGFCSEVVLLRW